MTCPGADVIVDALDKCRVPLLVLIVSVDVQVVDWTVIESLRGPRVTDVPVPVAALLRVRDAPALTDWT